MSKGWIGVDLDGTLAEYDGWKGIDHIGEPIPLMVNRVKEWLTQGKEVRIVTARVAHTVPLEDAVLSLNAIHVWCFKHLHRVLKVTCSKDFEMIELWDDRCVQVEKNTGRRLDGVDNDGTRWYNQGGSTQDDSKGTALGHSDHDTGNR